MSCDHEGSTHFACDCVLKQLKAADKLAKAVKSHGHTKRHWGRESCCVMCDKLEAYEKLRGK